MKKNPTDEELQKLWEENIGSLAYDLEEAFLEVFSKRGSKFQKPAFYLGAIAMAAGHVLQVTEKEFGYKHDLKVPFDDILKQTYNHYRQQRSEEDESESAAPIEIDLSKFN
jgi:hypothetical protein